MNCPNCGLPNPDTAKFCSNCGTSFTNAPPPAASPQPAQSQYPASQYPSPPPSYQAQGPYQPAIPTRGGNSLAKNVGLGCLILLAIFLFFGLSCTRACFYLGHNRLHHRYY